MSLQERLAATGKRHRSQPAAGDPVEIDLRTSAPDALDPWPVGMPDVDPAAWRSLSESVDELKSVVAALAAQVEAASTAREASRARMDELAIAVARVQATVNWIVDSPEPATLRADVARMAERIEAALGGPSIGDVIDRIDELADHIGDRAVPARRRGRRGPG